MSSIELIKEKFPGRVTIGKKELSDVIGLGESTINRLISENRLDELPPFRRSGRGEKARYLFPVAAVAEWLDEAGK